MAAENHLIDFDPYDLLGLEKGCTDAHIVKAFRKAALKWHPDKNPNREQRAREMFLKVSKAFELLSDKAARAAYDHVVAVKTARSVYVQRRQQNESEKRRKLREELERRESIIVNSEQEEVKAKNRLEKEIERLRKEGSWLLQRERGNIEREIHKNAAMELQSSTCIKPRYKLKWKRENDECVCYDEEDIRTIFSKYGNISDVVISSGGKGTAIIEFNELINVEEIEKETGKSDVPITVTPLQRSFTSSEFQTNKSVERPMTSTEFADFEAEILSSMLAGSKRKGDSINKFED